MGTAFQNVSSLDKTFPSMVSGTFFSINYNRNDPSLTPDTETQYLWNRALNMLMTRLGLAIARQVMAQPLTSMYQGKKKENITIQKPPLSIAYSCPMTYEGISSGDWASSRCAVMFPYSTISFNLFSFKNSRSYLQVN